MRESPASQPPLATWFRYCLLITAVFNLSGAVGIAPPVYYRMADILGLPKNILPFGLWVMASWILIFSLGYAWLFVRPAPERLFIAVAAACKVAIAICLFIFWATGDLPSIALLTGWGDFLFAIIFAFWLFQSYRAAE